MKTILKSVALSSFLSASLVFTSSCEKDLTNTMEDTYAQILEVAGDGTSAIIEEKMSLALVTTPDLNNDEISTLTWMREEERLARDVYSALYNKWGSIIFSRISSSENNHMTALNNLLELYGSADTVINASGLFANPELQILYNDLVSKGSVSLVEGLKVGALIEDLDIKDLTEAISMTSNENLIMVYGNLMKGSRNHIRAFSRQLKFQGLAYIPVYLSQEEYDSILNTPNETGNYYRLNSSAVCVRDF